MRILAALGGNALLERGEKADADVQLRHIEVAAQALAPLANEHELIVCFGNGPQIGLLSLESEADATLSRAYPLDVLNAQTQGMIGYWLAQSLRNAGVTEPVLAITTQTLVDAADQAFTRPTKFIGGVYAHTRALRLARRHGWSIARDGENWRRVVPSPAPVEVVELSSIRALLSARTVVLCGGGGAPVIDAGGGHLRGVEAVVDKDLTAALLAVAVDADRLLLLTDVPGVMAHFGTPEATALAAIDLAGLDEMSFPAGSMAPKVAACRQFVAATGRPAVIGAMRDAGSMLAGAAGTTIRPASPTLARA